MNTSRRQFNKLLFAGIPASAAMLSYSPSPFALGKVDSKIDGVQLGIITYSYRSMPKTDAASVLSYLVEDGLSATEMQDTQEDYAGAPKRPTFTPFPTNSAGTGGTQPPRATGTPRSITPEQKAALDAYSEELTKWRLAVSMDKYAELKKMYAAQGVWIYGFKIPLEMRMPDGEIDYAFKAAKACGANQLTLELPTDPELTKRIGQFAADHKMMVGYHAHTQSTPTIWDVALSQSPYNGINMDLGHYTAGGNHDQLQFIQKNHARITSIHLKDRRYPENGGQNLEWGKGDTPLKEALQLVKKEGYKFPCAIELEYPIPAGSDAVKEVAKCVAYAKEALA